MARSPKKKTPNIFWINSRTWMALIALSVFVGVGFGLRDISLVQPGGLQTSVVVDPYGFPGPAGADQPVATRAIITPSNLSILITEKLVLDGALSTGKNLKYRFEYVSGTPTKDTGISFPTVYSSNPVTDVTFTQAGTHKFALSVQDNAGTISQAVAYIQVSRTPNRLPVPKLSISSKTKILFFAVGQEITLDSEKSSDPDGTIQESTFILSNKPNGSNSVTKTELANSKKSAFIPDKKGWYEIKLLVKDNEGATSETIESIYVYGQGSCTPSMAGKSGQCDLDRIAEMIEAFNTSYEITP